MEPLIRTTGLTKSFGPNVVLAGVDFSVSPGEVHVLAGANGAGKSTLVKILYGALAPDDGDLVWKQQRLPHLTIQQALDLGIAYIAQEVQVVPHLSIAENIFLGNLPRRKSVIVDYPELERRAQEAAEALGLPAGVDTPAGRLSVAERQLVAIARALARRAELLLLDEPTASLSPAEIRRLFEVVARLKAEGSGVVFITHRLEEIEQIGDRITILRDGKVVFTGPRRELAPAQIVEHMTGRVPRTGTDRTFPQLRGTSGQSPSGELLRVENLAVPGRVGPISFSVRAGEVLGVAGVVGAGRTSLVRALFGAEPSAEGEVFVGGKPVRARTPGDAIGAGIALLTEDRKDQGLIPTGDVATNISLAAGKRFTRWLYFDHRQERKTAADYIARLEIRTPGPDFAASLLSGGNQQKVLFARWLCTGARVFLLDEPTRGIDVETKQQVYRLVRELAAAGNAIVFISSELPEVLEVSDRILVLHRGELCGEVARGEADEHRLLTLAMGGVAETR